MIRYSTDPADGAQYAFRAVNHSDGREAYAWTMRELNALPSGKWRVFTLDGTRADWWRPVSTLYI